MILLDTAGEAITWGSAASLIATGATLVGGIAYIIQNRAKTRELELKIDSKEEVLAEKLTGIKNEKHTVMKALAKTVEDNHQISMHRIDKTQEDIKKDREDNQKEFKQINKSLNQILGILQNQNNN